MKIYTKEFKIQAIIKYRKGIDPEKIIGEVEDLNKHNKYYSKNLLKKWDKEYRNKGNKAFIGIGNNTRKILSKNWEKDLKKLSLEEQNEYLKTKILYLEKERKYFFKKLPKKK